MANPMPDMQVGLVVACVVFCFVFVLFCLLLQQPRSTNVCPNCCELSVSANNLLNFRIQIVVFTLLF